jgi:hypothetical protein
MYSKYDRHKKTIIPPKIATPNLLKYPYFAIKHQLVIVYIDTNGASFGTTPFKSMGFQLGRPDRPEQSSYR